MKMYKNIMSVGIMLISFAFATSAIAQTDKQNNSRFGIKAGVNISNMITDDVNDQNILLGFNGGLFLKVALTKQIAFQPELLYTMKGSEMTYSNAFVNGTVKYSFNYFEVPLLAVVNLTENINIQGGVYVASLTSAKVKNVSNNELFNFENELNKDDFNSLDYGLVGGLGADFDKISFGIRYEYGLKTVGKERTYGTQTYTFPDARNSTLQFYLGISIL